MKTAKHVKKLISFTEEEWNFILKYTHENHFKNATEGVRNLAIEKMNAEKNDIDKFFKNKDMRKIMSKLADK